MKSLVLNEFTGLDWRTQAAGDPGSFMEASNVEVTTGKRVKARDQLRPFATVDSASRGLYVVNDTLRCAVPYPNPAVRAAPIAPAGIVYDYLAPAEGSYFSDTLEAVEGVAWWDTNAYICVKTTSGGYTNYEHHYIEAPQTEFQGFVASSNVGAKQITITGVPTTVDAGATVWFPFSFDVSKAVVQSRAGDTFTLDACPAATPPYACLFMVPNGTKVALPFEPGVPLIAAEGKIWAADRVSRNVWFSSTENGPRDWLAANDAGILPTARNAAGSQPVQGLAIWDAKLTVIYEGAMQIWKIDPDPEQHYLAGTVGAAGTLYAGTVANFLGDLVYFGYGGFRSLAAVVTTGQAKDTDIGAEIQPRTKDLDLSALSTPPRAVGSAWRSQYLCAIGTTIWVLTLSPQGGVRAWSKWDLPWEVAALVEWRSRLYVRRAGTGEIWVFDPDWTKEVGYDWSVRFAHNDCEAPGYLKQFKFLALKQTGTADVTAYLDPTDVTDTEAVGTVTATTAGRVPLMAVAEDVALEFSGRGPWSLEEMTLRFDIGRLA